MSILVTGGTGYIGSHVCVSLLNAGYEIIVLDNLSNSKESVVRRIQQITGKSFPFYCGDICHAEELDEVFQKEKIEVVLHFAGYKAVGESVQSPMKYYENNLNSAIQLIKTMDYHQVKTLVFSSSATVYTGALSKPPIPPITEKWTLATTNPYGRTKLMIEDMLRDLYQSDPQWRIGILRYFNPVGAHESGLIGEEPNGIPNNLMPYVVQVASGALKSLQVFGNDYETKDGTGVRDYIHVADLAEGHVAALRKLKTEKGGCTAYNLGTGIGYSVLDLVKTFVEVNQVEVPYIVAPRRAGDVDLYFADPSKAQQELGWKATRTLEDMCRDSWKFQQHTFTIDGENLSSQGE